MTMPRSLAASLLVALAASASADPVTGPARDYGPSWIQSNVPSPPGGAKRPAKVERDAVVAGFGEVGGHLAVQVRLWGDIADLKPGNKYQLLYQLRVHTRSGEIGPLLGTATRPQGIGFPLVTATADDTWSGMEESVDITRKDLNACTNLPQPAKDQRSREVFLRVEPQIYDLTAQKYLTPPKTQALILAVVVGGDGKVWEVRPLGRWLVGHRGDTAAKALASLADLDEFDSFANGVDAAIGEALAMADMPAKTKALFVAAFPAQHVNWKFNYNIKTSLEEMAKGADAELKAAAMKKLAEAK